MKRLIVLSALLVIIVSVSAQKKFESGSLVVTRWSGFWHNGIILEVKKDKCLVHSVGYGPGYDRWVEKKDIRFDKPKQVPKQSVAVKAPFITDTTTTNNATTETAKTTSAVVAIDKTEKKETVNTPSATITTDSTTVNKQSAENQKLIVAVVAVDKFEKQDINNPPSNKETVTEPVPVSKPPTTKEVNKPADKKSTSTTVQLKNDPPINNVVPAATVSSLKTDQSTTEISKTENKAVNNKPAEPISAPETSKFVSTNNNSTAKASQQSTKPQQVENNKQPFDSKSTWRPAQPAINSTNNNSTAVTVSSSTPSNTEVKAVAYNEKPAWNSSETNGSKKAMYHPTMIGEKLYLRTSVMGNAISISTIYLGKEEVIVRNPRNGVEPMDLVFEKKYNASNAGVYKIEGDKMYVIWSDGKPETWRVDYSDIYLYGIDGKSVTAQKTMPLNYTLNKRLILSGMGKDNNTLTVDFRYDGTFGIVNTNLLASAGGVRSVPDNQKGRYSISGNTLEMKFDNREVIRSVICMPVINGKKWLVINNSMFEIR